MSTPAAANEPLPLRDRVEISQVLRLVFGSLLLLGLGYWLIGEAIDSPARFAEVTLIGVTNGMI